MLKLVCKLTISTIIRSFTSCDATIIQLAVDSRSQSTMSARIDNDNNQLNGDVNHVAKEQSSDQLNI